MEQRSDLGHHGWHAVDPFAQHSPVERGTAQMACLAPNSLQLFSSSVELYVEICAWLFSVIANITEALDEHFK